MSDARNGGLSLATLQYFDLLADRSARLLPCAKFPVMPRLVLACVQRTFHRGLTAATPLAA